MLNIYKIYKINSSDKIFPEILKNVRPKIQQLYAIGNLNLLKEKSVAVVGSRNSTQYGRKITEKITKDLVNNDITIVSGMAVGIDSVAHNTCLKYGGKTIAVLGGGFNYIFPKENEKLFYQILENGGLILSEHSPDTETRKSYFPKRNRIISGLALGVLVIEATYRSGTSITAKYAQIQNKKIFCIPNSIGSKNSYGTINLLQNGAILVKNAKDIVENLGMNYKENNDFSNYKYNQLKILDDKSKKICNYLYENGESDVEEIATYTQLEVNKVNELVTALELDDIIQSVGFNKFRIGDDYYE